MRNPRHCEERSDEAIQYGLAAGQAALDCFAELVIGPATSGRTRWLAMTLIALTLAFSAEAYARDFEMGGDSQFPNSIMAPEPGTKAHHRATPAPSPQPEARSPHHASLLGREKFVGKLHRHSMFATRGSSSPVLPTPLPRTQLIPPEGSGTLTLPPAQRAQAPIILQGAANPIPSLPHGPETFQDRALRCGFQSSLNNVPGSLRTQYMGACTQ